MTVLAVVAIVGLLAGAALLRRHHCAWCGAPLRARDLRDHFLSAHVHESAPPPRRVRAHAA